MADKNLKVITSKPETSVGNIREKEKRIELKNWGNLY